MPSLHVFLNKTLQLIKSNSPEILTALGVSGVVTTAYLTGKATVKAVDVIEREKEEFRKTGKTRFGSPDPASDSLWTKKQTAQLLWRIYIPAGVLGALTVGCIICASKTNSKRTAAAVTAYSLTERAFAEYKEKVVEQIGQGKEQKLRDELVQEKIDRQPVGNREVVILGGGNVLCCELYTHRYFRSDMELLRKAQNDLNHRLANRIYVTLDEWYDMLGLSFTSDSNHMGWDSDKLMELNFSTALSDAGEPCLAFEYNYVKPLK